VVVEHDMHFVAALAGAHRTVTVLHEGKTLAEGTMAAVQADEKVIEVYLGR
jgi:urea transport system ATP-binding protein